MCHSGVVETPPSTRARERARPGGSSGARSRVITSALSTSTAPAAIANTAADVGAADLELVESGVARHVDAHDDGGGDDEQRQRDHDAVEHDRVPVRLPRLRPRGATSHAQTAAAQPSVTR